MTAPEDDLERALRRALFAAVDEVEPGADGLETIRARTSRRPPQPWFLAQVSAISDRVRNWTWRGHWAWPALSFPRGLRPALPFPRGLSPASRLRVPELSPAMHAVLRAASGRGWFRPAAVLAGVAFAVSATLAVAPLRQAV